MKNTAECIHHATFVDANALLKDDEYKEPSQVRYYARFKDLMGLNEALESIADMLGCITYIESASRLTVVGEAMAVDSVRQVWETALKNLPDDAE